MRHQSAGRKFGKSSAHRRAMFRNMATSLLMQERCWTTVEKAKDLRRVTEKLITLGKRGDLHARRQAYSYVMDKAVVHKLFEDLGPRFKNRNGGYLRIVRAPRRHGDAAEMAVIEFVEGPTKDASSDKPAKAAKVKAEKAPKEAKEKPKKAASKKSEAKKA